MDNEAAIKRDLPSDDEIGRLIERLNTAAPHASNGHILSEAARALAAMRGQPWQGDVIRQQRQRIEELQRLVYVPGIWKCAKCSFRLAQSNLNALDGTVTARDEPGDRCPNCDGPLWRVSEREDRQDAQAAANALFDEKHVLEQQLADERAHFAAQWLGLDAALERDRERIANGLKLWLAPNEFDPDSEPRDIRHLRKIVEEQLASARKEALEIRHVLMRGKVSGADEYSRGWNDAIEYVTESLAKDAGQ